jgi:SAM-dependent methyltransferase
VTLPRIYGDLADWYHLLTDPNDYAEEAMIFIANFEELAPRPITTMLELGCGGGANAMFMKHSYDMTLTDISPRMLDQSRKINPECEHVEGDMRTLRLDRTFDAVFAHDAITYMTTEDDLATAIETASVHCASPGIALFVPDETLEIFRPTSSQNEHTDGDRSMRYMAWEEKVVGTAARTHFTMTMRDGDEEWTVSEDHITGVFPRATWVSLIERAGFEFVARPYKHSSFPPDAGHELFFGLKR